MNARPHRGGGGGGGAFAAFPKQTDKCPTNTWRELGEGGEEGGGGVRGRYGHVCTSEL